jgi:hypothetical protein
MEELTDSIKIANLGIKGIEEGEEVQAKVILNLFKKITEHFPNLEITMPIQVHKASRKPNRLEQNRTTKPQIIIKTISTENRKEYGWL